MIQHPYNLSEIRQLVASNQYSAEQVVQHLLCVVDGMETDYAKLYDAALASNDCLRLETSRMPTLTRRRLEKLANVMAGLPHPTIPTNQIDPTYYAAVDSATALWETWFNTMYPNWVPESDTLGVLMQIGAMVSSIQCGNDCQAHRIKGLLIDAVGKLLASMVGSCTCGIKDPDHMLHSDICTYRLLHECYLIITQILDEVERVISVQKSKGDNNEQQDP